MVEHLALPKTLETVIDPEAEFQPRVSRVHLSSPRTQDGIRNYVSAVFQGSNITGKQIDVAFKGKRVASFLDYEVVNPFQGSVYDAPDARIDGPSYC